MKLYAELFAVLLAIFFSVTVIFYAVVLGFSQQLWMYIWDDLLLAAGLAFLLTLLQIVSVRRLPFQKDEKALNFVQTRTLEIPLSYNETMKLCIASLGIFAGARIREVSYSHGEVVGIVAPTWKFLPQVISFKVDELEGSRCKVKATSAPAVSAVRVDFGKNLDNIEKIAAFLKERKPLL